MYGVTVEAAGQLEYEMVSATLSAHVPVFSIFQAAAPASMRRARTRTIKVQAVVGSAEADAALVDVGMPGVSDAARVGAGGGGEGERKEGNERGEQSGDEHGCCVLSRVRGRKDTDKREREKERRSRCLNEQDPASLDGDRPRPHKRSVSTFQGGLSISSLSDQSLGRFGSKRLSKRPKECPAALCAPGCGGRHSKPPPTNHSQPNARACMHVCLSSACSNMYTLL